MTSEVCGVNASKLEALLGETFFKACIFHEKEKKNEENIYCMDCATSLCTHCLHSHQKHHILKIRRYMYEDVLGLKDAEQLIDCSLIQSYTINSAKVVYLKHKPVEKQAKCSGNVCIVCGRSLQYPFIFCSISCKIGHTYPMEERDYEKLSCPSKPSYNHIIKDSMHEVPSSISNKNCNLTIEIAKKKRSPRCCGPSNCMPASIEESTEMNRRKSTPRRSPMY